MEVLSNLDLLGSLLALLPGFLTAEIVGVLVLREQRTTLDRVIQALIYTFLAHVLWGMISWAFPSHPAIQLVGLGASALAWGLAITWAINTGGIHKLLQRWGLTQTASRPNEWYDAFYDRKLWVILHLHDGRRIFGWPLLYPSQGDKGHVLLEKAEWLDYPEGGQTGRRVDFLIDVSDVRFVEFLAPPE